VELDWSTKDVINSIPQMRKCKTCGVEKELERHFHKHNRKSGVRYEHECRDCINARDRQFRKDNPELVRAKKRAKYAANQSHYQTRGREDYWKRRDKSRARATQRRQENLELVRAQDRAIAKRWRANHPFESRAWPKKRRAIKRAAKIETITKKQIDDLFAEQRGCCAICKKKLGKKRHIDHIEPLSKGGAHEIKNLQILCPPCNLTKHHADPIVHMQKLGFLL
jgi:5-methylcytosine-specific restriction endonuclease McrA